MHLCEVSISNFRAIRALSGVRVHDLTTIVGKNDCGKSSVLMALQSFFDKKVQPEDFCSIGKCATELWVQLTFDQLPQELADQLLAERALDQLGRITLRRTFIAGEEAKPKLHIVCDDYIDDDFQDLPKRTETELNNLIDRYGLEPLGRSGAGRRNEERWRRLWDHAESQSLQLQPSCIRDPSRDTLALISEYVPRFHLFTSEEVPDTTSRPFQADFKQLISEALQPMKEIQTIREAGQKAVADEVSAIEHILLSQTSQVTALTPEINFKPENATTVLLNVTDHADVTIPLGQRGLGIQRLVVVAFLKRRAQRAAEPAHTPSATDAPTQDTPPARFIYAIEEPETYLHPAAQRRFFYDLRELSGAAGPARYQVIASTHSPLFVDRMSPQEVVLLTRDNRGVAIARQVEGEDLDQVVKEELGLRNSDYFFANCLLCFEGATEAQALPVFAKMLHERSLDEMGIQSVNLHGGTNAKVFLQAAKKIGVPAVLLADADANDTETDRAFRPSELIAEGLIPEDRVFLYPEGDFEYQFPDELLAQALGKVLPDECHLSIDEVRHARSDATKAKKKLGNDLQNMCVNEKKCQLSKPQLGKNIAICCSIDRVPETIRKFLEKAVAYSDTERRSLT